MNALLGWPINCPPKLQEGNRGGAGGGVPNTPLPHNPVPPKWDSDAPHFCTNCSGLGTATVQ